MATSCAVFEYDLQPLKASPKKFWTEFVPEAQVLRPDEEEIDGEVNRVLQDLLKRGIDLVGLVLRLVGHILQDRGIELPTEHWLEHLWGGVSEPRRSAPRVHDLLAAPTVPAGCRDPPHSFFFTLYD